MVADNKQSSLSSQVIAGLILAAILGAASFIPGAFKWILEIAADFYAHLRATSGLPNWSFYALALMSIHNVVYWIAHITKQRGPSVGAYKCDNFLGIKWRWSYFSGQITNLWAYCPQCDTMLVYEEVGSLYDPDRKTLLYCETCGCNRLDHQGDEDYLVQKIRRQIDRKIRTGEWADVVDRTT